MADGRRQILTNSLSLMGSVNSSTSILSMSTDTQFVQAGKQL